MTKEFLYNFIRQHTLASVASVTEINEPQAALVGIAVTPDLEIIFDTVQSSRKYANLVRNPKIALVIGWENETTLQYEGTAVELAGDDAEKYREIYYSAFPDGRHRAESWPGLVHFKISPRLIRYSNFNEPQLIEETSFEITDSV